MWAECVCMCCGCNLGLWYVVNWERLEITLNIEYYAFIHFGGAKIEEVVEPTNTGKYLDGQPEN